MKQYIFRLDDACEKRDLQLWDRTESLLDKFSIKPLVGIIPKCEDPMMDHYSYDNNFWGQVERWLQKGWAVAMHGYNHVYTTSAGGINPINQRSEFAGEPIEVQRRKIRDGVAIMRSHQIDPQIFFAPSHTFDLNTIIALKEESNIRIISDTIANKPYVKYGMTFIPQQSGTVRQLPFQTTTFCCHPNQLINADFQKLENFFAKYQPLFTPFPMIHTAARADICDLFLQKLYFAKRAMQAKR